jgi:hypothetical protein
MASTYPLEVVEAARWAQDPNNAPLRGGQLDAALQRQNWDPSVKSLVPIPQILQMMNSRLDWTQALGNAFLVEQVGVMDSVQRLRGEARAAGTLQSTQQETVSMQGQTIVIEPASPQIVYVPYYNPTVIYGRWGYPDYPPVYFPPPLNYGYVAGPGIYFGVGFGVIGALWGWNQWDWGHHAIHIDSERYNTINNYAIVHDNRPPISGNSWQHDPGRRRGVPYGDAALRQRFQPSSAGPASTRQDYRGFANTGTASGAGSPASQPATNQVRMAAPQERNRAPAAVGGAAPAIQQRPAAPAFSSFGAGAAVRAQSERGQASRQSIAPAAAAPRPQRSAAPAAAPHQRSAPPEASHPQHSAPSGGQKGGGNGKERH